MSRFRVIISVCVFAFSYKSAIATSYANDQFTYFPPGHLIIGSGSGLSDYNIYAPDIRFPIEVTPAYANSQVYNRGGLHGNGGSQSDSSNYSYPWRDNYCETRSWDMPMCPTGKGHQGQDIRPATPEKDKYWVNSVSDGKVSSIGFYWVSIMSPDGIIYRYLHMRSVIVAVGDTVTKGQQLGKVSDNFGDTLTTIHLHFDIQKRINNLGIIFVPPYVSLVKAYENLIGYKGQAITIPSPPALHSTP